MSISELVSLNLGSPAVLAFALGLVATLFRSDLRFPEAVTSLLSTYLLFAIGLKGGIELRDAALGDIAAPTVVTLAIGLTVPFVAYQVARRFVGLNVADAASIAAHYGSVSAVTFSAAETFTRAAGTLDEGYLPALVALLEIPGIIVAMVIASRALGGRDLKSAVHEVVTGKSIVLLVGGLVIGCFANQKGIEKVEPLFRDLFAGVLVLFLLDLGTLAAQRLRTLKAVGPKLLVFAIGMPLIFGTVGVLGGTLAGLSVGGAAVLGAMAASASYIAAPAAVRVGLPEADVGLSLGAALGMTFPFNLAIGIPLFHEIAQAIG
ncbi:MAG: sodium-dependent bicarbonate transport family permease [Actinobacteria bacterium]|nr:sodium-dependent bicarbonate transport family permease [Actinomycetota bacterium]NBP53199.1 sodium-dependent bicarbonate transport family permease [Actinomycetota bacterium]